MIWNVIFHPAFLPEFAAFKGEVREEMLAHLKFLRTEGPQLGRPTVDTLKGSKFRNLKELRFDADDGVWRLAFFFAPDRNAVLLVAGDKSGVSQERFYKRLIDVAEVRIASYIDSLDRE
jgi:hypothetical protein